MAVDTRDHVWIIHRAGNLSTKSRRTAVSGKNASYVFTPVTLGVL
jgi:hypothetical protein